MAIQKVNTSGRQRCSVNWSRFVRRVNSSTCRQDIRAGFQDSVWFYAAISALYFFLIGGVLVILLLAPKYKSTSYINEVTHASVLSLETSVSPEIQVQQGVSDEGLDVIESKDSIDTLPRDPLYYDIDPRSPIFRGKEHEFEEDNNGGEQERLRINSKFLQD